MDASSRLLAATDLSGPSLRAVDRAFELARDTGASCTVMHAMGMDARGAWLELLGEQAGIVSARAVERQREALERLVADPARTRGARVDVRVEPGFATDAVPACAEALDAALVVVGAHGHGFVQRVLMGTTSSTLIRKSRRPVLVVKTPCRGPYRRALVPVDFSPGSEAMVRFVRRLLPRTELVLLHVFDVPLEGMLRLAALPDDVVGQFRIDARQRALSTLHALADRVGLSPKDYTGAVLHGSATRQILSQERHHGCDLVVMGKHGTHVTEDLLLGSVTKRVLAESRSDVLVVVDGRRPESWVTSAAGSSSVGRG
jgi:CPA2 family monovalent cation:H+ antiporter-2